MNNLYEFNLNIFQVRFTRHKKQYKKKEKTKIFKKNGMKVVTGVQLKTSKNNCHFNINQ